uniref:Retroviral polymerase SH3-like domain-containing protein n=1 Tax=Lactuca sativa TaxID=4236 RepID=A0A9R1XVP3_LACSA|nr:hypothetical protein LSAT_V11C200071580 [Lactuca sativa]
MKIVFIGYAQNNKAYRLIDDESGVVIESRDVEFFKDKYSRDFENSNPKIAPITSQENVQPSQVIEESRISYQNKVMRQVIFSINLDDDRKTFIEAMSSRDAPL